MKKNRRTERFDLRLPAEIKLASGMQNSKVLNLITENVSSRGAFFLTEEPMEVGTRLKIQMVIVPERPRSTKRGLVRATGVVSRTDSRGMAVTFEKYKLTQLLTPVKNSLVLAGEEVPTLGR